LCGVKRRAEKQLKMNHPQQAEGYRKPSLRTIPNLVTPNVFIEGPDPDSPGFPLKTCGNDGLWFGDLFNATSWGMNPQRFKLMP
jgi:hypothetical protein